MNKRVLLLIVSLFICFGVSIAVINSFNKGEENIQEKKDIYLEDEKINLLIGEKYEIANIDELELTYKVEDNSILSIDNDGKIYAKKAGKTNVIISADNYNETYIEVIVEAKADRVTISEEFVSLEKGSEKELNYSVEPQEARIESSYWKVSEPDIVDIIDNKIIARKVGKTKVTIVINGNIEDSLDVEVYVKPSSIELDKKELALFVGDKATINYNIYPRDALNDNVKWVSSNEKVIKVDQDGNIEALSKGKADVTVITTNKLESKTTITVEEVLPNSITLNKKSIDLYVGKQAIVTSTILPSYAKNKNVTYTSSNVSVASIDNNGKIIAKKVGKSIITVKTINGKAATMTVYVRNNTYNKSAIFFGDSITYGEFGTPPGYSWANYIGDNYDLKKIVNAGKCNWLISNYYSSRWIVSQVKKYKNKTFDYVIMHGGTNDIHNGVELGEFEPDDFSGKYNQKTFLGGLETYIYTIKKQWPNAKVGYIINYETPLSSERRIELSPQYYSELKKVLNKWGIKYIDLYFGETSNGIKYSDLLKVDTKTYLTDGLHLNYLGYKMISPYIYNWMNTL